MKISPSWWLTDKYVHEDSIPSDLEACAGPNGLAVVRAWSNGKTSEGWGLAGRDGKPGFMEQYVNGEFLPKRHLYGYYRDNWHFAFVMRSLQVVAIDIDGKNGGIPAADALLANAAPTLAETSKSGTGYHLFYMTELDWDPHEGFNEFSDSIGIVQGVDIRGTGCVYHHKQQRWNGRQIAPIPDHLRDVLRNKQQHKASSIAATAAIGSLDEMERLLMQDDLLTELAKPIPQGKRNNTLFAIGSRMKQADMLNWDILVRERAVKAGLDVDEADKLVHNISAYGG